MPPPLFGSPPHDPAIAATLAAGAALLLAGVALKRAEERHAEFVEDTHVPLHQEDR